ncbi:ribosome maturation factor RimM [Arundinibacter roseus]|uniref:Ribosome maturation factor RimM n=1 Tax=Arundinibacter roseus TaxID=2070510 RepID=A0A4R4JRX2_9BACT|nr:ribosome maturation factor RimM [Arundinibacter roseus]TDB57324.1 16S rRNA processing protein RimM [Arundinibacter roseus]
MTQEQCYLLGYIVKTHGTKGQVVFHLDVDYPDEYEDLESVFIEIKGELVPYFIENINIQKQSRAIVQIEEIDTIEKAQTFVGHALYMPLDTLDELEEDQFYYHEIKDFSIIDQEKGELGFVREVYSVSTQNLIALDYKGVEVLIPIVDDIVLKVNRELKQVVVQLPEGLLEVYTETHKADDSDQNDDEN